MEQFMEKVKAFAAKAVAKTKVMIESAEDTTYQYDPQDIEKNKWQGWLSYLSFLCLIPLFMNMFGSKKSEYGTYNAKQGFTLAVIEIVALLVLDIFDGLPLIGWIFALAGWLVKIAAFILSVVGIMNVCAGKAKELPFIGKIRFIK